MENRKSGCSGDYDTFEIERKFLIEYPEIEWLESDPNCTRAEIVQTYLNSEDDDEIRVRERGTDGNFTYFHTLKRKHSGAKRVEIEKTISEKEYINFLRDADPTKRQIKKTRYCLEYGNHIFEIDIYPFWDDRAVMEIELKREDEDIVFPNEIKIIKEVTDDDAYKNSSIASLENEG